VRPRGQDGGGSVWTPILVVVGVIVLSLMAVMFSGGEDGPFGGLIERIDDAVGGGYSSMRVIDDRGALRIVWKKQGPARVEWNDEVLPPEDFHIRDGLLTAVVPRRTDGVRVHHIQAINPRSFLVAGATTAEKRLGLILGPDEEGGLAVREVLPDTPASAAGFAAGDVLLAVDGSGSVTVAALRAALVAHIPGGELLLTARRSEDVLSFAMPLPALVSQEEWDTSAQEDPLDRYLELAEPEDERFLVRGFVGPPDT
jgi:hypothetical protein